jgi:voltage-gated potassium channel
VSSIGEVDGPAAGQGAAQARLTAEAVEARFRVLMIAAALLVIPDLILEEQPLRAQWHEVAVIGDWAIWLVFAVEFLAVMFLAHDRRVWLRHNPLAVAMLVLTPPFAPASLQGLRAFRLLRLLRVGRSWEFLTKLVTLEGLKYLVISAIFLVLGGGAVFASVESHAGHHVSTWDGIYWAIGTMSTEGSPINATTDAGRAISIVLMLLGIGLFSMITAALAQRFIATRASHHVAELSEGEERILEELARLSHRMERLEGSTTADGERA